MEKGKNILHVSVGLTTVIVLGIFILLNSFYTLSEDKVAVLSTFGKPEAVTDAGIHFKVPFIQDVYKISKEIRGMRIGYTEDDQTISSEAEMITKDFNFVIADFYIEYQVVDPIQAYIHRNTAINILECLAQSYIRDTVGIYSIDEVITTGKAEIQQTVKSLLSQRIEEENIGLAIVNVSIQDSEIPTKEVETAFKSVEDAKQNMDTKINEANKYASEQIPAANAKADKALREAEAYKQQRISEAEGQVARFNAMYDEYVKYPLVTQKRMFYETMEELLPSMKVIIDESDGTQTVLPLGSFVEKGL